MRGFFLISAAIATLFTTHAQDIDATRFSVIHTPNYDLETNNWNTVMNNRMGVRLQGDDLVYVLSNNNSSDRIVYTGEAPSSNAGYQYVVLNEDNEVIDSEPFYRISSTNGGPMMYDFFKRKTTVQKKVPALPNVTFLYDNTEKNHVYKTGQNQMNVHPMDEIPTFHIQTKPSEIQKLHSEVLEDIGVIANVTRITSSTVEKFHNVKIELSGQTSRLFKKLSYSININKNSPKSLHGYRKFKIRSCATDPSYLREKIYYDMLAASNLPTAKTSFIRLFINEEPQGLFLLADNYKNPFLEMTFGANDKKYKHGSLFQGSMQENPLSVGKLKSGANLAYLGPHPKDYIEPVTNTSVYKVQELGHGIKPKDGYKPLVKFIHFLHKAIKYNLNKKKSNKKVEHHWNKRIDVPLFLKHMAYEIIMGHNDGYMGAAHNYMLYQDPDQKGRLVWLASDLDQTLGSTLVSRRTKSPSSALEELDRFALLDNLPKRPLASELLQIDIFKRQFYQIFADLHFAFFESNTILNHVQYLQSLIEDDVAWDKQLDAYRPNNFVNNETVFQNQLNQKVLQLPLGPDFYSRINMIDFDTAINGTIQDHPSITSLEDWFNETSNLLYEFVTSVDFKQNKGSH